MDFHKLMASLENCPCGKEHGSELREIFCENGLRFHAGERLAASGFPKDILFVADENTRAAAEGLEKGLADAGYRLRFCIYPNMRTADMREVRTLLPLVREAAGVLAVGTGSVGDICRMASFLEHKPFAIFATAPSMDGFASGSAPITEGSFKTTRPAQQPLLLLADTEVLAKAPAELKSAGFGDMIAKYTGLVDWRISHIVGGEYLCERLFDLTREAVERIAALADRVLENSEEAAAAVFEALVLTGVAMRAADCSRPGSGTEHILSHFWECKKLEKGELSDYHGKKCGVATLLVSKIYHEMAAWEDVAPHAERVDWAAVREAYGPNLYPEVEKLNFPTSIAADIDPQRLRALWPQLRRVVAENLPTEEALRALMLRAGCATTTAEIGVSDELCELGLLYHPFMRRRLSLMRLKPMLG